METQAKVHYLNGPTRGVVYADNQQEAVAYARQLAKPFDLEVVAKEPIKLPGCVAVAFSTRRRPVV